jgi:hypothetical protein
LRQRRPEPDTNSGSCWNLLMPASRTSDVNQDPRTSWGVTA